MPQADWMIRLDNASYRIELEHGLIMGNRRITVNGQEKFKARKLIDFGSEHCFDIDGRPATVTIRTAAFPFVHYNLYLNGKSYGTITPKYPSWLWLFCIPLILTFLNTLTQGMASQAFRAMTRNQAVMNGSLRGGIAGGLLGLGFAMCAAVALNKNLGERTRMVLCALVTMLTGTLTLLVLNGLML
jgi:hypothetical protein